MYIIRPIRSSDYDALYAVAEESGIGFTSLPVNELPHQLRKPVPAFKIGPQLGY